MSKIASNVTYGGAVLRKCIDYFCHLSVAPQYYQTIADADKEFAGTEYFQKMTWLRHENDDLYDPSYNDLLRVAFTSEFGRGKFSDLVSLLSGRNFETRTFEEEIAEQSFAKLRQGVLNFINENNFKRFIMIIKSAGFVDGSLIRSRMALNFAYILYLKLRNEDYNPGLIESYVRKWFVLSLLTQRYSGSSETYIDYDIRNIAPNHFEEYLSEREAADLSDGFWNVALIRQLETFTTNIPAFNVYLAAQCKFNHRGFLSKDITIRSMIEHKGDLHHIFPKDYLRKQDLSKNDYNQVANYVYMQTEINIKVGHKAPAVYFAELAEQCNGGPLKYGGITSMEELKANMGENDIPETIFHMSLEHYKDFLRERRLLISRKIKQYYESL